MYVLIGTNTDGRTVVTQFNNTLSSLLTHINKVTNIGRQELAKIENELKNYHNLEENIFDIFYWLNYNYGVPLEEDIIFQVGSPELSMLTYEMLTYEKPYVENIREITGLDFEVEVVDEYCYTLINVENNITIEYDNADKFVITHQDTFAHGIGESVKDAWNDFQTTYVSEKKRIEDKLTQFTYEV